MARNAGPSHTKSTVARNAGPPHTKSTVARNAAPPHTKSTVARNAAPPHTKINSRMRTAARPAAAAAVPSSKPDLKVPLDLKVQQPPAPANMPTEVPLNIVPHQASTAKDAKTLQPSVMQPDGQQEEQQQVSAAPVAPTPRSVPSETPLNIVPQPVKAAAATEEPAAEQPVNLLLITKARGAASNEVPGTVSFLIVPNSNGQALQAASASSTTPAQPSSAKPHMEVPLNIKPSASQAATSSGTSPSTTAAAAAAAAEPKPATDKSNTSPGTAAAAPADITKAATPTSTAGADAAGTAPQVSTAATPTAAKSSTP
jgi:hypothetical protein